MTQENNTLSATRDAGGSSHWYKNKWVWLVISIPVMAVMMSFTTAYFAVFGADTLVRDNYYKDGLAINQELDYETRAKNLGIKAQIMIDARTGVLSVQLENYENYPERLNLIVLHPTVAEKDQDVLLKHVEQGRYTGTIDSVITGRYHLQLMSEVQKWRIKAYRELGSSQSYNIP